MTSIEQGLNVLCVVLKTGLPARAGSARSPIIDFLEVDGRARPVASFDKYQKSPNLAL